MPQGLAPPGPPGKKCLPRDIPAGLATEVPQPLDTKAAATTWGHILTAPPSSHSSNEGAESHCFPLPVAPQQNKPFCTPIFGLGEKNHKYSHILGTPRKTPPLQSFGEMHQSSSNPTAVAVLQHHHRSAVCYLLKCILSASLRNTRGCQFLWRAVNHEDQPLQEQPTSCRALHMLTSLLCTF